MCVFFWFGVQNGKIASNLQDSGCCSKLRPQILPKNYCKIYNPTGMSREQVCPSSVSSFRLSVMNELCPGTKCSFYFQADITKPRFFLFHFFYWESFMIRTTAGFGLTTLIAFQLLATSLVYSAGDETSAASDHAVVEALLRLPNGTLDNHPAQRSAVLRYLSRHVGTGQYIKVARQLNVYEQTDELIQMLASAPDQNVRIDAAKLLIDAGKFDAIQQVLHSENADDAATAARTLGFAWHRRVFEMLKDLMQDDSANLQLQIAAVESLGRSEPGQRFLLDLAKSDAVSESLLFTLTNSLLESKNKQIRLEAEKVLSAPATAAREKIPTVSELAKLRGSADQGKAVFQTVGTCIKCHKVQGEGKEVGPDLSEIGGKLSREDMYVAILNPSAAVSHNYETYTLLDVDGRVVSGLLMNQTDAEVTIRNAEGVDTTVPAADVEQLKKQAVSLMPADLQKSMSLENLVDLVDYLITLRKPGEGPFQVAIDPDDVDISRDAQQAVAGFDIAPGLAVELFAAEPQLLSPTSIDVDHLGRVWVCEAVNYRHFRNTDNEPRSEGDRILVLEDTDGDGRADKQTVFYQDPEIDSPHGVCVLGKQIIVSAGEHVLVFTDEDGDLKPDSKKVLFSGISGVQHDHGIHAFGVGPDGKLYFNFGNEGKQLRSAAGETIVDKAGNVVNDSRNPYQQGMVFRCNPDGTELETLGWNFRNNWEVCVDSFGTMWQSDNDDDGNRGTRINFVMEFGNYGYRDELTGATWKSERIGLEKEIPLQHWHLNDPGVVPNILQTGAGSPTGICFYEGDLLPAPFQNQIIHTDPGPNVVRAYPVEQDGAGYRASIRNLVQGVRDPWFRPVDVCAAPDGSLFVADWYDPGVGGHRMGDIEHGRIFRVIPAGHKGYVVPKVDLASPAGAVEALQSPNLATRFMAQQKLAVFGTGAISELEKLFNAGSSTTMRARALWQLGLVGGNPDKYVEAALASPAPELRIVGIRMARQHNLNMLEIVKELVNDTSPQVRRELAIALRHNLDSQAADLWVQLAVQHNGKDRWYLEALGIAADRQWDVFFDAWLRRVGENWNTPAGRDIVWRCRSPKACKYLAEIISETESEEEQYRYFRAFDFHEGSTKLEALSDLLSLAD